MKEKKSGINTVEQEKDTTAFEKFEDEVKGTIFNVLYVLLKEEESSHWKHIVLILFDFVQIYHFSFAYAMHFPWKSDNVLHYLQTFLDFFQIAFWIGKLDMTTYLVFFYICIFIVCLVILDIFYVSYSFTKKKFTFVWPLQLLRSVCGLFVTVLFLPFLETFTTMIHCHEHHGHQILTLFPEQICWHGTHIIHATFSIVVSSIFIVISLVVSLTYFESKSASHDISARVNSRGDTFIIFLKIILIYIFAFLVHKEYHWFIIAVLLILSFTAYFNFRNNWPYYSDNMNKFFCVLTGVFVWANICLFVAKILESTEFSGALQLYFLGLPLVIGLVVFNKDERVRLLLRNINNFQRGEEVALQIRYFLHLIQTKDHDRRNAIILKGYIYHHEDSCPNQDCQLKLYKQLIAHNNKTKKAQKKQQHATQNQNLDHYNLLIAHSKNMYRVGIQKFPNCTSLKIQYAFFLMERMEKKSEAISELAQASMFNPPFDEQFIIYRYQKMSEDYGDSPGEGHGGGLDVVAKFAYESSLKQCQMHIQKSAALHLEFWNLLRDDRPDIAKLNESGSKINQSIAVIESYWTQLQKLNSNVPKALKMYAKFLIEILNDKEGGQDLLQRAKDTSNVKQNYYDGNNMHDDLSDIAQMSSNGTPCIYIAGDTDKIGMITQCNSGACRIFGFTPNEIKNHGVEKLMPEMYAKNHGKVVEEALQKGPENIPNKERLVFGRHKSGYIFPVWAQIKMIAHASGNIQFVALFKIDKKIISSNIAYILINKDKKIQGISSSCMQLMNLDIQKMKRLSLSGIDINKLAPSLFENEHEGNFLAKQGGILDWYVPDFDKIKKNRKEKNMKQSGLLNDKDTIAIGNERLQFSCNLNVVTMGDLGEIGWYLRLEAAQDKKQSNQAKGKEKERVKQQLFQFRFEPYSGKFVREIKDNIYVDNAARDPNYLKTIFQQFNPTEGQRLDDSPTNQAQQKVDVEEVKIEVAEKEEETSDYFELKKRWAKKIQIYRLVNGKFQPKDYDEELKKSQQLEDERKRKIEEEEKDSQNVDVFKNNIKSRKALQMAINDKTTPRAIKNLNLTMNLVIVALMAIAITEFSIISSQFKDINENFNLIQQSYGRISEVQRIAYNIRTLIMINEKKQTVYKNYTSKPDFVEFLKSDIEESLNSLYELQNAISLTSLSMSSDQQALTETKSVLLYFRERDETQKTLKFTLTEAVLQISSAIFTARHLNFTEYTETQEDLYFITYNVYNNFLEALRKSSKYYVDDLHNRTNQKNELILILFLSSIGALVVTMTILLPVISNVNMARMKVLSLFVDIPNHHVIALADKCEKFLSTINDEHNDEVESEDGDNMKLDDSDVTANPQNKRGFHKQPKNYTGSNKKTIIQFGTAGSIILAYFVAMFVLSKQYISNTQIITNEMNVLAQAESYYSFAQNVQREMIYNPEKPILNENSAEVAKDSIEQLYSLNQIIMEDHFHNKKILKTAYKTMFSETYEENLCDQTDKIKLELIPFTCEDFIDAATQHGLQTVLAKYFETLKETLQVYLEYQESGKDMKTLINHNYFLELYIIQFRFIQDSFRGFVDLLKASTNGDFQSIIDTRMAAFIVFVISLGIAYLILWTPFVSKLNKEIWRTKSMLTIIPIEVILKIPRIQQFLHSQSFFQNKPQA